MQIIKSFFKVLVFICPATAFAQSTYLNQGSKEYHFIDRLEIKQQTNTDLNFSTLKPYNRRYIVQEATFLDSARMGYTDSTGTDKYKEWTDVGLTAVDEYNLKSLYMNNSEWYKGPNESFASRKPFLKTFYKTQSNFYEVNTEDFFLAINPALQFTIGKESDNEEMIYLNSRGATLRGMIGKRIGFSAYVSENQERGPSYFTELTDSLRAVHGVGFYKNFKGDKGYDYFDARGYITFNAAKFIDFQLGYDKNFIGNGYRSLFLSDWGNSNLFVKINTRIWKFNYQNLFMELMPQFGQRTGDFLLPRKYAAMHHLSMNVTKWLNVGLFEGVIFGRKDRFDFQYLNPIIFYRHIEGTVGSPDNAIAGLDFKANIAHRFQVYGQLLADEFKIGEIRDGNGWWANKFGYQVGAKYIDAFGIKNLDLQGEINRVRPYTYAHRDSVADYTHYNQPLSHPLGANFNELIGIVNYQPFPKLHIYARLMVYQKGLDSTGYNAGGNIFRNYTDRSTDYGYDVAGGRKKTVANALLQVSYEWKQNIFFDVALQQRNYKIANQQSNTGSTMVTASFRMNMFKRQYDY